MKNSASAYLIQAHTRGCEGWDGTSRQCHQKL